MSEPVVYPPDAHTLATGIAWRRAGHAVHLVTLASTWGSAPRPAGSLACVRDDGAVVGSVSGGCIERELAEQRGATGGGRTATTVRCLRVEDDTARRVGLSCGGRLELIFEAIDEVAPLQRIVDALLARRRLVRVLDRHDGTATLRGWREGDVFAWDGQTLVRPFGPDWRVLLIGAGELSRHVAQLCRLLDFEVVVCEPRAPFRVAAHAELAPLDELPDEAVSSHAHDAHSAVLALSHDPTLDDLALEQALAGDGFYLGALGSLRSHRKRCERLVSLGVPVAALARIHAPVGLDIGSRTAPEIAVSIAAELVQARAATRAQGRVPTPS